MRSSFASIALAVLIVLNVAFYNAHAQQPEPTIAIQTEPATWEWSWGKFEIVKVKDARAEFKNLEGRKDAKGLTEAEQRRYVALWQQLSVYESLREQRCLAQ